MKVRTLVLAGTLLLGCAGILLLRASPEDPAVAVADSASDSAADAEQLRPDGGAWQRSAAVLPAPGVRAAPAFDDAAAGWVLEGRVTDISGRGIARCTLLFASGVQNRVERDMGDLLSRPLSREGGNERVLAETIAGPAGEWRIELVQPPPLITNGFDGESSYAILAEAAGYRDAGQMLDDETRRRGGVCDIVMTAGATLRGRVVGADGAPVASALVSGGRWFAHYTTADGCFRMQAYADTEFDLAAIHPLGTAVRLGVRVPLGTELDLGDLVLVGPGILAGRVLFPDGSPAPQLPLCVREPGFANRHTVPNAERAGGNHAGWTRTDEAGRFQIAGLRDAEFQLRARVLQGEYPLAAVGAEQPGLHASRPAVPTDFVLPWCLLLVDAPAEAERATAELIVAATPAREDGAPPSDPEFVPICTTTAYWGGPSQALLFAGPGWLRIQATASDGRTALARIELKEGTWLYRCSLSFAAAVPTGSILIRSRRPDGTRHPWLKSELRDPERGLIGRATSYEGHEEGALLAGVPAGRWQLTVSDGQSRPNYDYQLPGVFLVEVRAGETSVVDWTPALGGALEILADTDGTGAASGIEPSVRATVLEGPASVGEDLLLLPAGHHRPVAPSADFRPGVLMKLAAPMPPGVYLLRVRAAGFAACEARVALVAGEVARCEVRLEAGG